MNEKVKRDSLLTANGVLNFIIGLLSPVYGLMLIFKLRKATIFLLILLLVSCLLFLITYLAYINGAPGRKEEFRKLVKKDGFLRTSDIVFRIGMLLFALTMWCRLVFP